MRGLAVIIRSNCIRGAGVGVSHGRFGAGSECTEDDMLAMAHRWDEPPYLAFDVRFVIAETLEHQPQGLPARHPRRS